MLILKNKGFKSITSVSTLKTSNGRANKMQIKQRKGNNNKNQLNWENNHNTET